MQRDDTVDIWRRALAGVVVLGSLAMGLGVAPAARADQIRPFDIETYAAIVAEHAGRPFLVTLWSVDCPPCREELAMLGELKREQPDFPLVLIATDSIDRRADAALLLDHYGLAGFESWMFADAYAEPLRFSIDPGWYGELPRSYFYAVDRSFTAHSGVLTRGMVDAHFR